MRVVICQDQKGSKGSKGDTGIITDGRVNTICSQICFCCQSYRYNKKVQFPKIAKGFCNRFLPV